MVVTDAGIGLDSGELGWHSWWAAPLRDRRDHLGIQTFLFLFLFSYKKQHRALSLQVLASFTLCPPLVVMSSDS